ncbi:MAG: hypothetical protein M5U34_32070 [Chloroflexi bacterium]|nr:hypothetical protein [Chloroflexota bacterium]
MAGLMVGCQAARFEKPPPTPIVAAAAASYLICFAHGNGRPPENIPTLEIPVTAPTATINPDTGWQTVQGLERRHIFVLDEQNQPRDRLTILRLDPLCMKCASPIALAKPKAWKHGRQKQRRSPRCQRRLFSPQKTTPTRTDGSGRRTFGASR